MAEKKEMSAEVLAKIAEAHAAKMAGREKQIVIGKWRVFRFDDANMCVQDGDDEGTRMYYPTLDYCLRYVLHQEIGANLRKSTKELLGVVQAAEKRVMGAAHGLA